MIRTMAGRAPVLAITERTPVAEAVQKGPTVVFLHGLGCERGQFARQLEGLDPRLRLISLDLPGHGESPELCGGGYGIAAMAAAVGEELCVRGCSDVVLVGHSAGGILALRIAAERPGLVRGVMVLDTNVALDETGRRANRIRADDSEASDWRRCFTASMTEAWGAGDGEAEDLRASVFRTLETTPEYVVRPLWREVLTLDPEDLWRRCPVPSLYVRSKRETDLDLLRALSPLISAADLRPRFSGHWPHLQRPETVNEALHGFIARLESGGGATEAVLWKSQ